MRSIPYQSQNSLETITSGTLVEKSEGAAERPLASRALRTESEPHTSENNVVKAPLEISPKHAGNCLRPPLAHSSRK